MVTTVCNVLRVTVVYNQRVRGQFLPESGNLIVSDCQFSTDTLNRKLYEC